MNFRQHKSKLLVGFIALFSLGLYSYSNKSDSNFFEIAKNLEIFTNVYKEINTHYVDDIEPAKLMRTGLDAMLESLDPYTNFISESEIEGYRFLTTGKYGGIGSSIRQVGDYVIITEPYEGFPADVSGLKAGDKILEVDGKSAKNKNTTEVSDVLKGTPGTDVDVLIDRPGTEKPIEIKITRAEVKVKNVPYYGRLEGDIGYITLTTFTEDAGKNVADALKALQKEGELKGVIFDLRGNGGGLLREAINVSNVFVDKGLETVTTRSKVADWDKSYKTLNNPVDTELPLVVLVNGGSASASEIVSGAIQDFDRGVLIGQRTYGKGLVQNTKDVGYNSKVKMTISKYYIPSGRCIQKVSYDGSGNAVDIPDSLRTVFYTENKRPVLDGGGVDPDLLTDRKEYSLVLRSLIRENLIFDFVTDYVLTKEKPASIDSEMFSEDDFSKFVSYLSDKEYQYQTKSENVIDDLSTALDKDKFSAEIVKEVEAIKEKLTKEKEQDVYKYKDQIIDDVRNQIATRFFLQKGKIRQSLSSDVDIKKAKELLSDLNTYKSILSGSK